MIDAVSVGNRLQLGEDVFDWILKNVSEINDEVLYHGAKLREINNTTTAMYDSMMYIDGIIFVIFLAIMFIAVPFIIKIGEK